MIQMNGIPDVLFSPLALQILLFSFFFLCYFFSHRHYGNIQICRDQGQERDGGCIKCGSYSD